MPHWCPSRTTGKASRSYIGLYGKSLDLEFLILGGLHVGTLLPLPDNSNIILENDMENFWHLASSVNNKGKLTDCCIQGNSFLVLIRIKCRGQEACVCMGICQQSLVLVSNTPQYRMQYPKTPAIIYHRI